MKKFLNTIKNYLIRFYKFCTKNYMTTIMSISILLIIIGSIIIIFVIDANRNKIVLNTKNINSYYYFQDEKINKKLEINYENNKIVDIKYNKNSLDYKTIIYSKNHVIIGDNANIIFPASSSYYESLSKYSEIDFKTKTDIVISEGKEIPSYDYFIYSNDLYFFPKEASIEIDGNNYNLSNHSYVRINKSSVQIYDYNLDHMIYIDSGINKAIATYMNYKIDLLKDVYKDNSGEIRLLDIKLNNNIYKEER